MTRLEFEIVRPISLNHAWYNTKFGRRLTPAAEAYKEAVGWATKVAAIEQAWEPSTRYQFTLRVWFPDNSRRRDLDNLRGN